LSNPFTETPVTNSVTRGINLAVTTSSDHRIWVGVQTVFGDSAERVGAPSIGPDTSLG
jgi:hypothetical protein